MGSSSGIKLIDRFPPDAESAKEFRFMQNEIVVGQIILVQMYGNVVIKC